ncbi:MAG: hypothetical protein BGO98_21950 [Myxococcales bacterium 68-20]|nr:hypothetical protein [Myxococcales bacterium]OJY15120.1 MAG: hypothetical protein BGO98_21950 [Myxococcales bacterium 68-20]
MLLDTDNDAKPDLLYSADDRGGTSGGIYKWISADGATSLSDAQGVFRSLTNISRQRRLSQSQDESVKRASVRWATAKVWAAFFTAPGFHTSMPRHRWCSVAWWWPWKMPTTSWRAIVANRRSL